MAERTAEIIGPFQERHLVVNGYQVPLIQAIEEDGGRVLFIVDGRFGYDVPAASFEQVAFLVADTFAVALGLSCWPPDDSEQWREELRRVHIGLRPRRVHDIVGPLPEHECEPSDDPRDDG